MRIFGTNRLAAVEVALYDPARAGVNLLPVKGRWPEHERADRLALGLGLVCLAPPRTPGGWWDSYRTSLRTLAIAISEAGDEPLPGDLLPLETFGRRDALEVVPWRGSTPGAVEADVVSTRAGLVPRLRSRHKDPGPGIAVAAMALVIALAADGDHQARLGLALSIEGTLACYRESERHTPPRQVFGYALEHARNRLVDQGAPLPPGLAELNP